MWYLPALARLFTAYLWAPVAIKRVSGQHSRPKRFVIQYLMCAMLSLVVALIFPPVWSKTLVVIFLIAMVNALGAYCQWCAMDLNLSRDSLFTIWDDIIGITLSYFILKESQFLSWHLGIGIILCLSALGAFIWRDLKQKAGSTRTSVPPVFYVYVLTFSLIWGVIIFLMKYWNTASIPATSFIAVWYPGCFVGSLLVFAFMRKKDVKKEVAVTKLTAKNLREIFALSLAIFSSLLLGYLSYGLAPQIIVQPIYLVAEMTLPAIIGLLLFKERKGYDKLDWLLFALAIVGGVVVGTSRYK
jgi:hypothetical protein